MFDSFLEGIGEFYDDIDGFFKDLTGGEGVLDTVKGLAKEFTSSSSAAMAAPSQSLDLDYEISDYTPVGVMSDLERAVGDSQAIRSVDPQKITRDWYNHIYQIATGEQYNGQ